MADDIPLCKETSCVHVYDTTDQQMEKIIDMCNKLHVKVPVLIITNSSSDAMVLKARLQAAGTEVDSIQLLLEHKIEGMALETVNNWREVVYHTTNQKNMAGHFRITITDNFGGGFYDLNLEGTMAVIITSIPAWERAWKSRTGSGDSRGQYAVVLNSMDKDSPLASVPDLLKDYSIRDDHQILIPNLYDESLIKAMLKIRDEAQKEKLLSLKEEILRGKRLNRLCDAFYIAYKRTTRSKEEVLLNKLLCDPMVDIDKAFRDLRQWRFQCLCSI